MKFSVNQDLPVLKELLACEVHGIQSVPVFMFSYPNSALEEHNYKCMRCWEQNRFMTYLIMSKAYMKK